MNERKRFLDDPAHVRMLFIGFCVLCAIVFGLAHLFYLNWVAVMLTMAGGLVFAWAHVERGSFWLAGLLHMIAGWAVFTAGLGGFFYHGAI